jgi:hypothetical protein
VIALCIKLLRSNETAVDLDRLMHYKIAHDITATTRRQDYRNKTGATEGFCKYKTAKCWTQRQRGPNGKQAGA